MTYHPFTTTLDDAGTAWVTLNRPDVHNAFDDVLIGGLAAEFMALNDRPGVRAVVLRAAGKSFSAGGDLDWMRRMADYSFDENVMDANALAGMMQALNTLSKPTIAMVQGAAFGGGVGLVACCDIAVAAEDAVFCLSEVKLGLVPATIAPYVISAIGPRQARRYFQTAERFDAATAKRIGLVHEVVPAGELRGAVDHFLGVLRGNGPGAMAASKDLVFAVAGRPVTEEVLADTAERIAAARASAEGREGTSAFLQKRKPSWAQGR
ncbi:MAG: enoyl-CoA hydratase/isomerase family protein [Hyphomicrobiales bacterium]|nr:enoyl-CoA hydratase/isomerase family protein [Hyphomicrobiales bacterium]MCP5373901.1 enoyl-CoA hydratase/isomerase family protein [Hyphomicrobiales bacterium]